MKRQLLCVLTMAPIYAFSQPIINNAEDFSIGTVLHFQQCDPSHVNPGNAGAVQVWDFSGLTAISGTTTEWMVTPASTKYGAKFPTANLVEKYSDGRYVYVNKTAAENNLVGFVDTASAYPPMAYSNPMLFARRPFEYGVIITDTFTLKGAQGEGIVTIHPYAYGTLVLPNGTHTNVLRVKISQVHPYYTSTVYVWFDGTGTSALLKIADDSNVEYLISETKP